MGAVIRPYRVGCAYWLTSVGVVTRAGAVRVAVVREAAGRWRGRGRRRPVHVHLRHGEDALGRGGVVRAEGLQGRVAHRSRYDELETARGATIGIAHGYSRSPAPRTC